MPRKALTPEEKALALLQQYAPKEQLDKIKEELSIRQSADERALEAEAILLYFDTQGSGFTKQICPTCTEEFAYKYKLLGKNLNCSDTCRREALNKLGIKWDPNKTPEERWGMPGQKKCPIPLVVPPAALKIVESKLQESHENNTAPVA